MFFANVSPPNVPVHSKSKKRLFGQFSCRCSRSLLFFLCILIDTISLRLAADDESEPNRVPAFQSALDIGVVALDDDVFFALTAEQRFQFQGFSLVISAPLRFRILDRAPADPGVLRRQDWDEPSDFARIVPAIAYSRTFEGGGLELSAGALRDVTIGTAVAVNHYFNTTDMDAYKGGFTAFSEYRGNALDFMLDNVVAPSLVVGNVQIAPLGWFLKADWARRLYLGFTCGADINAPLRAFEHDARTITVMGGEVGGIPLDTERVRFSPSLSVLVMDGDLGVHVGGRVRWNVSPSRGAALQLRAEYRYSGPDYHPGMFNPFYDFNRFHYPLPDSPPNTTFADQLSYGAPLSPGHGLMIDFAMDWREQFRLGAVYDREGNHRSHWVMFYTVLSLIDGYRLGAFFAGQDISGGTELLSRNSIFSIEARARIWRPIDIFLYFTRRWREIETTAVPADEFGGGFGAGMSY